MSQVLVLDKLAKTFKKPFSRRTVEAVNGISFNVEEGEIFGFLGPNGAGKTTTIKMLMGLIFPTGGNATIFGEPIASPSARANVGFLPENPYVYPYLTPREFVTMCGRLSGVPAKVLPSRVEEVITHVGIRDAIDRPARNLSKGMLQRTGLAAAIVHEPKLLLLDEPMSGLDPVGRKEVRDVILAQRKAGRTVMFSSHILSDVELLCDRVCILKKGTVVVAGHISELLSHDIRASEITLLNVPESLFSVIETISPNARRVGDRCVLEVQGDAPLRDILMLATADKIRIESVIPKRETLEEVFVKKAL